MNKIQEAAKAHEEAALALMAAVKEMYPIGTTVAATLGKARITAEVTGHNEICWWHEPGSFRVRNLTTGKIRTLDATSQGQRIEILG